MRATVAIGRAGGGARGSVLLSSMLLFLVPSLATAMALAAGLGSYMALPTSVAETLASRGYQSATPIQAVALTRVYSGESLMLHAETGSGKTLAMLLPALCRTAPDAGVLILSPTRELTVIEHDTGHMFWAHGFMQCPFAMIWAHELNFPAEETAIKSKKVMTQLETMVCGGDGDDLSAARCQQQSSAATVGCRISKTRKPNPRNYRTTDANGRNNQIRTV